MSEKEDYTVHCDEKGFTAWPLCPFKCKKFPCELVKDKCYNTKWTKEDISFAGTEGRDFMVIILQDNTVCHKVTFKNLHKIQNIFKVRKLKAKKEIRRIK